MSSEEALALVVSVILAQQELFRFCKWQQHYMLDSCFCHIDVVITRRVVVAIAVACVRLSGDVDNA